MSSWSLPKLLDTILSMNQSLGVRFFFCPIYPVWVDRMQSLYQAISLEAAVQLLCLGGQAICSLKLPCLNWASVNFFLTLSLTRGGSFLFRLQTDCFPVVLGSLVQRSQRLAASLS